MSITLESQTDSLYIVLSYTYMWLLCNQPIFSYMFLISIESNSSVLIMQESGLEVVKYVVTGRRRVLILMMINRVMPKVWLS